MAEKQPEDVEHIMAIVGQSEGMNDGVVVYGCRHNSHGRNGDYEPWESAMDILGVIA